MAREVIAHMYPELRVASRNRLMVPNDQELRNYFAQLYLSNGSSNKKK